MIRKRFQSKVATSKFTLPVVVVLSTVLWIVTGFVKSFSVANASYPIWQETISWIPGDFLKEVLGYLLYAITGYLLVEFNNAYSIIRVRTSLQTSVYFLLIVICPALHTLQAGNIAALCLMLSLYFLLKGYQRPEPVGAAFISMLFMGLGTLFFPQLFYFVPVYYIGAYTFKSLALRPFFAGIIGLSVPYWFLAGHAFFYNEMELFYAPFLELVTFKPINYSFVEFPVLLTTGFVAMLFLVGINHYLMTSYQDKIRTRSFLNFISLQGIVILVFGLLQPQHAIVLLQLFLPGAALLIGHLFALTNTKTSNIFFIFTLILSIILTYSNLWML